MQYNLKGLRDKINSPFARTSTLMHLCQMNAMFNECTLLTALPRHVYYLPEGQRSSDLSELCAEYPKENISIGSNSYFAYDNLINFIALMAKVS